LNWLLFSKLITEQVIEEEQEVIIRNNNLLFHFSGHNKDLLVLKLWKGALNWIMPALLGLLKNNLALRTQSLYIKALELRQYPLYNSFPVTDQHIIINLKDKMVVI